MCATADAVACAAHALTRVGREWPVGRLLAPDGAVICELWYYDASVRPG